MVHARRLALLLTLPVWVAACDKGGEKKAEPTAPTMPSFDKGAPPADKPAAPPADPNAFPEPGKDPIVRLLAPGKDPRKPLRVRVKAGDTQRAVMHMKMAMDMNVAGQQQKADVPTMNMVMDMTIREVAANGDVSYEFVMSDVTVSDDGNPGMKQMLETVLGSAKGMSGKGVVTSRGFNRGAEMTLPPGANPQLEQTMGQMKDAIAQMAVPLPEEPVGVGGKWEVRLALQQQGMVMKQVGTYEVTSIAGDQIGARVTVAQTADPQPVKNPQMPSLKMDLVRMNGSGTGETQIDLTRALPPRATATMGTEVEMNVDAGGQKQSFVTKMTIDLKVDEKL
jgi:hypothetical protein